MRSVGSGPRVGLAGHLAVHRVGHRVGHRSTHQGLPGTRATRRVRAAAAAALLVAATALGGCASVRSELGTPNGTCYIGLPRAVAAVHHHGHLFGVRLVNVTSLARRAPLLYQAARTAPGKKVGQVCLVAFTGNFAADQVEHAIGRPRGHLAVVELGYPSKHLFATLLVHRAPLAFGHSHA